MKIAYVEWNDSCTTRGWQKLDDSRLCLIKSVGLIVRETKDMLVLSTSIGSEDIIDMLAIPKGAITKIIRGKFPKKV